MTFIHVVYTLSTVTDHYDDAVSSDSGSTLQSRRIPVSIQLTELSVMDPGTTVTTTRSCKWNYPQAYGFLSQLLSGLREHWHNEDPSAGDV